MSSVFVIDMDAAWRETLVQRSREAGLRARGFGEAATLFAALPDEAVACVVVDVSPDDEGVPELVRRLSSLRGRAWNMIAVSASASVPFAVKMMKLGALDFMAKPLDPDFLIETIQVGLQALDRETPRRIERERARLRFESLTGRERQVFDGLVQGQTTNSIAFDLQISARTVEIFRGKVMTKMAAGDVPALVRSALLLGR